MVLSAWPICSSTDGLKSTSDVGLPFICETKTGFMLLGLVMVSSVLSKKLFVSFLFVDPREERFLVMDCFFCRTLIRTLGI